MSREVWVAFEFPQSLVLENKRQDSRSLRACLGEDDARHGLTQQSDQVVFFNLRDARDSRLVDTADILLGLNMTTTFGLLTVLIS